MCSTEQAELEAKDLIAEYLTARGFLQTFAAFQTEWEHRNRTLQQSQEPSPHSELQVAFECGEREVFFTLWDAHVPASLRDLDHACQQLEFSLAVYFATHPASGDRQQAMADFRAYLETRGAELAQSPELAAYFALPYIPDPSSHPSFKKLFLDSWSAEVKGRLVQFLNLTLPPPSDSPRLVAMVINSRKVGSVVAHDDSRLAELQESYHTLVAITMELVGALESSVAGNLVSPDYIRSLCSRLFQNSSPEPVTMATPEEQPRPPTSQLRASVMSLRQSIPVEEAAAPAVLDFERIKHDLTSETTSNETKTLLIQALRWRVTRSLPGRQRSAALAALTGSDLLGCQEESGGRGYQQLVVELMGTSDDIVREQLARLFNSLASTSCGRGYLSQATPIIQALLHMMYGENEDTHTLRNALGALQKLSLRGRVCDVLIEGSAMQFLLDQLLSQPASLSDYTLRYAVAFLMNMSLRPSGRQRSALHPTPTLQVLTQLLEYDSAEMCSYVNGILYSLFQVPALRDEARKQGMLDRLAAVLQTCAPDMQSQVEFVMRQLDSHDLEPINEDLGNDDDDNDEEDEEDPEHIEGDEEEPVMETAGLSGEPLLVRDYLADVSLATAAAPSLLPPLPHVRPVTPQSFQPHSSSALTQQQQQQQHIDSAAASASDPRPVTADDPST